ncbi:hypothetical protein I4F81_012352 [Pyropia yezoensis]|uniref:Uncharacterized protein n=1 Tax=Pyropia yezoensis TaxID=2788 RepID=A0ACC3CI97_PYRYE|nr:hypothetical protein I4F81_012352 [Neopyropia yezoensis]
MDVASVHLEWRDVALVVDSAAPSRLRTAPGRLAASLRAVAAGSTAAPPPPAATAATTAAAAAAATLRPTQRALLSGVSGGVRPGQVMAIMGPSGAGKTTLLNLLAGRLEPAAGTATRGSVTVNGTPRVAATFRDSTAYVEQDDAMYAALTVREQIDFTARLRLPQSTPPADRAARVEAVLAELGLTTVADRRVGGGAVRGVSGGERKRTAIGMELVTDPQLILCDEPTAGLDAAAALAVVRTLKTLAGGGGGDADAGAAGAASRLWMRLGVPKLGRLGLGSPVGAVPDTLRSPTHNYVRLGMEAGVPMHKAGTAWGPSDPPADHVAYIAAAHERHMAAGPSRNGLLSPSKTRGSHRVRFATPVTSQDLAPAVLAGDGAGGAASRAGAYPTSPWYQLWVLLHRAYLLEVRAARSLVATVAQTTAISIILGMTFLRVGRSAAYTTGTATGITTVVRLLGTFGVLVGVLAVINVHTTFPLERLIMLRERAAHSYRTSVYFVAYSVRGMLRGVLLSMLLTVPMAVLAGLRWSAIPAIVTLVILLWCAYESLALVVAAALDDIKTAVSVTPSIFSALVLYSGFLIKPDRLPAGLRWIHHISFLGYAFSGMVRAQLEGATFNAPLECITCMSSGERALTSFGIGSMAGGVWGCAAVLAGTVAALRLLGFAVVLARGPSFAKTM